MTVYELRLDPQDVGKVIGRQGMTINAIRSLAAGRQREEGTALSRGNRGRTDQSPQWFSPSCLSGFYP